MRRRLVVGMSGASGSVYGVGVLRALVGCSLDVHLVISPAAKLTLWHEMKMAPDDLKSLVDFYHPHSDIGATIASGSFESQGMIIAPCSANTMSEIAHGIGSNLLTRAASVVIKEQRKLVLMVRESPLHLVHLRNMVTLAEMGVVVLPPVPYFYNHPQSIDDIVNHSIGRALTFFGIEFSEEWPGIRGATKN